jgi:hypothetical protein
MMAETLEQQARFAEIERHWQECGGFESVDKRKRDGKMMAWCADCAAWEDEGHDEGCAHLAIRDLLDMVRAAKAEGAREALLEAAAHWAVKGKPVGDWLRARAEAGRTP